MVEEIASSGDESGRDLSRITAFSDGVFAIAMTLLVLSLEIPNLDHGDIDRRLREYLSDEWAQLLGYALSFFVIARFWMAHHRLFRSVRVATPRLIALNLGLLGFVALLPYPTGIMGRYGETTTACVLYAATMTVTGALSVGLYEYAVRSGAVPKDSEAARTHDLRTAIALPAVFLISIPIAFWSPTAASATWSALLVTRWIGTWRTRVAAT